MRGCKYAVVEYGFVAKTRVSLVDMRGIITIVSQLVIFSNCLWIGSHAELLILLNTLMT